MSLPKPLVEVLEEEDLRLYGRDGVLTARRWELLPEEIIDGRGLARSLSEYLQADAPDEIRDWAKAHSHDVHYKIAVANEVNAILDRLANTPQWLFDHPRFRGTKKPPFDELEAANAEPDRDAIYNINRRMFDVLFEEWVKPAADTRYAALVTRFHERAGKGKPRTAFCISGGGIRSATFALGVMQRLAVGKVLAQFDYVSTVSGGGYIGSWLSSWTRRDPWGIRGVSALLAESPTERLNPEPLPLRHLRAFSNYLTPRLGILSADTWALVATYLRNLLLNWVVLVPLLAGVLAVPRFIVSAAVHPALDPQWPAVGSTRVILWVGLACLAIGLMSLVSNRPTVDKKKQRVKALTDGKFIRSCIVPYTFASILLTLWWAWKQADAVRHATKYAPEPWPFLVLTTVTCLVAFAVFGFKLSQSTFVEKRSNPLIKRDYHERIAAEFVASIIAGLLGGWLLWLIAVKLFHDPRTVMRAASPIRWGIENGGSLDAATAAYVTFAIPLVLLVLFLQAVVFVGASSQHNHDFDREWWARASGWVLVAGVAWIVLAAIAIYGPVAVHQLPRALSAVGGVAGAFSLIAGWSAKTKASSAPGEQSKTSRVVDIGLVIAVPLFAAYLLSLISLGTTWTIKKMQPGLTAPVEDAKKILIEEARVLEKTRLIEESRLIEQGKLSDKRKLLRHRLSDEDLLARELRKVEGAERTLDEVVAGEVKASILEKPVLDFPLARAVEHLLVVRNANPPLVLLFAVGGPILAFLFSRAIGVNVFSMHAMYRNRLVRAYLGASRWRRDPNTFTGFDPDDNLSMDELRPEYVWAHSFADFDAAVRKLTAATQDTKAGFLRDQIRDALGSDADAIFENGSQLAVRRQALCKALNILIATRDLPALHDSAPESHCILRPMRNRRFIELAFDDTELYPSPMPLLCQSDLVSPDHFVEAIYANEGVPASLRGLFSSAFRESVGNGRPSIGTLTGEINLIIATATLKDDPVFRGVDVSAKTAPYQWLDGEPVHRMIDNRLRLDHEFSRLFVPLSQPRPLHVVNTCLNLTTGDDLARQERKGASLTISPLASGSHILGYRDTRTYGEISLGTAVTISGAAASPNMGYHSSPALAFLMTLFNVRLGWWLGNPGFAGAKTHQRRNPKWSITPFLYEATGNTNERYGYVYLSDGGHFENLGFYEMVLRRCHSIVITDAGADPAYAYDDLGNAIRKIGIDLGIPIEIERDGIIPPVEQAENNKLAHKYCAVGRICYSKVDGERAVDGEFLYIKPVVYKEKGPRDVRNYAKTSAQFPHESTADQFFSETQFESYRHLGFFATDTISTDESTPYATQASTPCTPRDWPPVSWKDHPVSALIERARSYLQ